MNPLLRTGSTLVILAVTSLLAPRASSGSNLILNGGFELGTYPGQGQAMVVSSGGGGISSWTVTGGGVRYCDYNYWEPADGSRSLALNTAAGPGGVEQSFATYSGAHYVVRFFLSGDPSSTPTVKNLRVSAAGASGDFQFDTSGMWPWDLGWLERVWNFTANSATTTLAFTSLDAGSTGPALDSVTVALNDPLDAGASWPREVALALPAPNPAHGPVDIGFALPREASVHLSVFDVQGREISVLAAGPTPAGQHHVIWDGRSMGQPAPPGLYLVRLLAPGRTLVRRLMVAR